MTTTTAVAARLRRGSKPVSLRAGALLGVAMCLARANAAAQQPTSETSAPGGAMSAVRPGVIVARPSTAAGIERVVADFVLAELQQAAALAGYLPVAEPQVQGLLAQLGASLPLSPADLWRLAYLAHAHRAIGAHVWAEQGRYVVEVAVASLDGRGPFVRRAAAGPAELRTVVAGLVRELLPTPQPVHEVQPPAARQGPAPASRWEEHMHGPPEVDALQREMDAQSYRAPRQRWIVALQTEAAVGASAQKFYNHLLGARIAYRLSKELSLGAYLGYANLRGRDSRVHNLLGYLQLEDRVQVAPGNKVHIPIRGAVGYLPRNGVVLRLGAGVSYPFNDSVGIVVDIVTPTFWIVRGSTLFSLDFAIEIDWRF
ncbi:MAG: hypothetical protein MJD61_01440 [Proteobacteria bacterium]|nr:hypothetical protein [Pseudomonadota bacterium]